MTPFLKATVSLTFLLLVLSDNLFSQDTIKINYGDPKCYTVSNNVGGKEYSLKYKFSQDGYYESYSKGGLVESFHVKNKKLNGWYRSYHNHKLFQEGNYKDSKGDGVWFEYSENGEKLEMKFSDGELEWVEVNVDGEIKKMTEEEYFDWINELISK